MYKLSIPLSLQTLNETSLPVYLDEFKKANVKRIFLIENTPVYLKNNPIFNGTSTLGQYIAYFKQRGFEVGVWLGGFGHGNFFSTGIKRECFASLTKIKGADGQTTDEGFCPLDENLQKRFCEAVRLVSAMHPDLIMLDDDFRLNVRDYNMGCCCENHLKLFYDEIGETIPAEKLEELIFTGPKNKYRSAWLKVQGKSLESFAKMLRSAVDEVDETIRLGACAVYSTWDFDGTDMISLSKILAGKTRPFMRTIGAPYHRIHPQFVVEHTRLQASWCKDENIEIFAEGDNFPRPRYACPANFLELFDMAILASGATDGILKYMFDFRFDVNYEKGYNSRHIKNKVVREKIEKMFSSKALVGVRVFDVMRKIENFNLPTEYKPGVASFLQNTYFSVAAKLLCENAIPTTYEKCSGFPVIVFGENAEYIDEESLENGAILDVVAAKILKQRGIDTGIIDTAPKSFSKEFFPGQNDGYILNSSIKSHKAECKEGIIADSVYLPDNCPASYRYENKTGQRFYVFLTDMYRNDIENCPYFLNYYRQQQLTDGVFWLCGTKLPAVCNKNPYLYIQAAKGNDGSMSIGVYNMNFDEVTEPVIYLDKSYKKIEFVNCEGSLQEDVVTLSRDIPPYSAVFFEVK